MNNMIYCNYHKHTHYSNIKTLDCVVKPLDYIKRAKELGHTSYVSTEHGFQGNIFEAYTLCQEAGLKLIYGVEAYYVKDAEDKTDRRSSHLILIALTENARREINKIMSLANTIGFYYRPRIDLQMLLSLPKDEVIITTACIASPMFKDNWEEDFFLPVWKHFGKNFFLEVQCHVDEKQKEYNKKILEVHKKYNIPLIHANDSHYIYPEDAKYRDLFLKAKGIVYEEESGFVLDYPDTDEIYKRYEAQGVLTEEQVTKALENTLVIESADGVSIDKEFKIPKVIDGDSNEILKNLILDGWKKEKQNIPKEKWKEYADQILYEYNIIKNCGMADYFILDHYIVKKAVEEYNAILTRTGRGSAVSFYVNKLLGLTEVDRISAPITLYPTRFMSAERILQSRSLPDIDLNFADVKPVIKASKDLLGEDGIYYMVAYKPLQESSAFRLWCKSQDMKIDEYNDIAKNLDCYFEDLQWKQIIEDSKVFRGVIESIAPSPCSFLLSNDKISEMVGLVRVGEEICCALDGYNCDVYKFLKNDYLTVSVYQIINDCYKLIDKPIDNIQQLLYNCDEKVWDIYAKGLTTTINQCDSDYDKQILKKYKPKSLGELSAYVAAIRPGFASLLNNFVERQAYTTGVQELDDILEDSFHYLIYQESIMKYLIWLGIEEKESYDIIKKIAKKKFKEEELKKLKEKLLSGWITRVGKEDGFDETWQVVNDAAHYSFNASHSLCVALDSIYGAYLKSHYPIEYFTVALTSYIGDEERTNNLTSELVQFGIKLRSPIFRHSKSEYWMEKETNTIYKGINSIKGISKKVGGELYEIREKEFKNFLEFLVYCKENTSIDKASMDLLIRANYFEEFGSLNALLYAKNKFELLYGRKTLSKAKIEELGLFESIVKKNCTKETEKQYSGLDSIGLIMDSLIEDKKNKKIATTNISDIIKNQSQVLGYISYSDPKIEPDKWIVLDNKRNKYGTLYLRLYNICYGAERNYKVDNKWAKTHNVDIGDMIVCILREKDRFVKTEDGSFVKNGETETVIKCWKKED